MDKCRLDGKAVYAFGVYDNNNNRINRDYEDLLRKASREGKLICEYCGGRVRFNMGKVIIPYFSHVCEIEGHKCRKPYESENHKKGKMILFQKLIEDYSDAFCEISYKFNEEIIADVYIKFKDGRELALEYEDHLWDLAKVDKHKEFYKSKNIHYRRFINSSLENLNEIYASSEIGYLYSLIDFNFEDIIALDCEKNDIIMFSKMVNSDKSDEYNEVLFKRYKLADVTISEEGTIICDFQEQIEKLKAEQYELMEARQQSIQKERKEEIKAEEAITEEETVKKDEDQQLSLFDML